MPRLPWQWHDSVAQASLAPPASVPERYIELWWYSGNAFQPGGQTTASGSYLVAKGTTSSYGTYSTANAKLYTVNSSWPTTTKFAFEAALNATGATTTYACLWDCTSNTQVSGTTISLASSSTYTVVRSGQFTLTPGHSYGIAIWNTNGSYGVYITDASLIVFS